MSAAECDLEIEQGSTFQRDFTWKTEAGAAIDITNYTIRMMARINLWDAAPVISLTTPATGITITNASGGEFQILISAVATAAYSFSEAHYDIEAVGLTGTVIRLMEGTISVSPERTK